MRKKNVFAVPMIIIVLLSLKIQTVDGGSLGNGPASLTPPPPQPLSTYRDYPDDEFLFPSLPVTVLQSDNIVCKMHSDLYAQHLDNHTLWAHEMWDATGKSASGVLRGSVYQMGHFEQCLTADAPFPAQYCLVTLHANVPKPVDGALKDPLALDHDRYESVWQRLYKYEDKSQQARNEIKVGWCIPAACTPTDLDKFLNYYVNSTTQHYRQQRDDLNNNNNNNVTYTAKSSSLLCQTREDTELQMDAADILFCLLAVILVLMVIATTIHQECRSSSSSGNIGKDEEKPTKKSLWIKLIMSFSVKRNFHALNRADESDHALKILYGMKTLCICMIITDHRYGTFISAALQNFDYIERLYRTTLDSLLFHGDLFVDSFFILSGLLVTYGLLEQLDKKRISPAFIIFARYVRLTPVYAFVIFYYATMFAHTGTGPFWKSNIISNSKDCATNWWTNLLYINNYVNSNHMCMEHSWYLPCDFHYFIIGIILCLLIHKSKRIGLIALLLITVTSVAIPFVITIVYTRPALLQFFPDFFANPKSHADYQLTYIKSHTRATPYFIGMFTGYIYHRMKGSERHIGLIKSHALVAISFVLMLSTILVGALYYNPYYKYNVYESAVYASFHRALFAMASCAILYVTSYGRVAILYNFLAWQPFVPLSKLVYSTYLVHMQFQLRAAAKFTNPQMFSLFDVFTLALSDIVLGFAVALVLYLTIEAPVRHMFRELMMSQSRHNKDQHVSPLHQLKPVGSNELATPHVTDNGNTVSHL